MTPDEKYRKATEQLAKCQASQCATKKLERAKQQIDNIYLPQLEKVNKMSLEGKISNSTYAKKIHRIETEQKDAIMKNKEFIRNYQCILDACVKQVDLRRKVQIARIDGFIQILEFNKDDKHAKKTLKFLYRSKELLLKPIDSVPRLMDLLLSD
jgi:hypothetical protein